MAPAAGRPPATGEHEVAIYSPASSVYFGGLGLVPGAPGIPQGGGAELQMALLAAGLVAEGLDTAVVVWPGSGGTPVVSPLPSLVRRPEYVGASPVIGKLAEAVHIWRAVSRADARVYIFRGGGPQLLVATIFSRLRRRRVVFSAAIDLDFSFSRPDRGRLNLALYRLALRRADLIVAQREEQAELARGLGLDAVTVIPSFAETTAAAEAEPEAFLWIGRLVDYKRPLEFARLAETLPEIPFRMVWFATDETGSELQAELEEMGNRLDNLELLGQLPRPQVLDLIARSAAVVSTSSAEGVPNVFLEAWSRGVPVISLEYDPDGKIASGDLGLVAGGSRERLKELTRSLWQDGDRRLRLGRRGRDYVRETHSPDVVARRWAEVIRGLLGGDR